MTTHRVLQSVTGECMVILQDSPAALRFELHSPPRQPPPPLSAHPTQEERFHVLAGHLRATIAGTTGDYGPGERFTVPPNTVHRVRNVSEEPACAEVAFVPACGMLPFFEDLMGLRGMNPLGLARVLQRHDDAVRVSAPFAQILAVLGLVVRTSRHG
jgi:mannose-6-phosphate isomerase-like protein (cupin superfamily)